LLSNSGTFSIFTPQSLYETINALAGPDGVETTRGFIGAMVTKSIPEADKEWIIERNLRMPRRHAATLLYNHATQDWRDLIRAKWFDQMCGPDRDTAFIVGNQHQHPGGFLILGVWWPPRSDQLSLGDLSNV